MNVTTSPYSKTRTFAAETPASPPPAPAEKPSALDSFSTGAAKGGQFANTALGIWNGGVTGGMVGGAVGLGTSALSAGIGALTGSSHIGLGTVFSTMGKATGGFVIGAAVGGTVGGLVSHGLGKFVGGLGAKAAEKAGLNPEIGRAAGTVGTGVLLGTLAGLSVAGMNGATVALTCGLVGGGVAFLRS